MLVTKKKFIIKKLLLVTAMMVGVFGLTGCTIKDVVVDKSQKDQTNLSYYNCDLNKTETNWVNINGDIEENGSMCIPGIFLAKDVPEFNKLTVNDLKIIMDSPVVYTNGTVDPNDPRVVTFTSPGNDVYAFTQEGFDAYNATGNETIQINYEIKYGCLDSSKPFRIYSYFGIKNIFLNNEEVENSENFRSLYDFDGSKRYDIDFSWYYDKGKNTIKVVDFLGREKEITFDYETYKPKYETGDFLGKYILIYSSKSDIEYIKINGKKINFKKKKINRKKYFYYSSKKRIDIFKNKKKAVKIEIKYKNGYVFKYKL